MVRVPDPDDQRRMIEQLLFPDNVRGDSAFERYEKRYERWKEGKKKLDKAVVVHG
jgi:hypothetical protein